MSRRIYAIAAIALVLGLALGYMLGRWSLEREWSQPEQLLRASSRGRSGADPVPPEGTRGIGPMPLARSRRALAALVARDPVVVTVASVGRDDEAMELHLTAHNRSACPVVELAGVAYGFDAWGAPARMNVGGEHFVAFEAHETIEPGGRLQLAFPLRHPDTASLVLAQVDRVGCADGTRWARR